MANLQIPHIFLGGTTLEPQEVNTNFAAVAAKFGALTTQDISSVANIANSQLANDDYEFTIEGSPVLVEGTALAADAVYVIGTIPYEQADEYTLLGVGFTCVHAAGTVASGQYAFGWRVNTAGSATEFGTATYLPVASTFQTGFSSASGAIPSQSAATAISMILYTNTGWPTDAGGTSSIPAKVTFKFKRTNGLR